MNVYLEAAQEVFSGREDSTCCAITNACGHCYVDGCAQAVAYIKMFRPENPLDDAFWLQGQFDESKNEYEARLEWRLTALCFAAAMHDAGDL